MKQLRDLYRGLQWLSGLSAFGLPIVLATQPASYTDGLLLSVVLASTFFVVVGVASWLGVLIRRRREAQTGERYLLTTALRQALVLGVAAILLLVLQLLRVITAVDAVLVLVLAVVVDLYLGSRKATPGQLS